MVGPIDCGNHSLLPKRRPRPYLLGARSDFWNKCLKSIRTLNQFFAGLVPLAFNSDYAYVSSPCSESPLLAAVNHSWWAQWTQNVINQGLKEKQQRPLVAKSPPASAGHVRHGFDSCIRKIPWRRAWQPTPLPSSGESHGQRSLVATVRRVANSQTQLKWLSMHARTSLP